MSEGLQIPSASGGSTKGQFIPSSASNQARAERDAIAFLQAQQPTADDRNRLQRIEVMAEARRADDGGESLLPKASPVENRQSDNADYQTGRRIGQAVQSKAVRSAENAANRISSSLIEAATAEASNEIGSIVGEIADQSGITKAVGKIGEVLGDATKLALSPVRKGLEQNRLEDFLEGQGLSRSEIATSLIALKRAGQPLSLQGLQAQQTIEQFDQLRAEESERRRKKEDSGAPCDYPSQRDSVGRRCGGRSAVSRRGGKFG